MITALRRCRDARTGRGGRCGRADHQADRFRPAEGRDRAAARSARGDGMTATRPSAKILVVDDEPDLEALITQKFRRPIRQGAVTFLFAHDGQEALDSLSDHHDVDMVVCDINMPRMDGLRYRSRSRSQRGRERLGCPESNFGGRGSPDGARHAVRGPDQSQNLQRTQPDDRAFADSESRCVDREGAIDFRYPRRGGWRFGVRRKTHDHRKVSLSSRKRRGSFVRGSQLNAGRRPSGE
jgi:hypothetical protein